MKKLDMDRIVHNTIQTVTERAEKAGALKDRLEAECQQWARLYGESQGELAYLREKIAWYFECLEFAEFASGAYSWRTDKFDEAMNSHKHAEQALRGKSK